MGSSRYMTQEDKDSCNKIILKRFDSRRDAVAYEIQLHEEFDVGVASNFWNKSKQTVTGFDTTGRKMSEAEKAKRGEIQKKRFKKQGHPNKGVKQTEDHKRKVVESRAGYKHSADTKAKMSLSAKGINNPSFKPWWYKFGGSNIIEVYDKTPQQVSEEWGIPYNTLKDRFRKQYHGKPKANEPFKGIVVGRINE